MSTAVLYSGQLRTFAQCYPTQKWHVFRHYPDCHFFFVVQNDAQANSLSQIQRDYPGKVHVKLIDDPVLPEIPNEAGQHAPYANAAPHKNLLLQHWYQLQVWEYYRYLNDDAEKKDSDTFIRMRPDNWAQAFSVKRLEKIYSYDFIGGTTVIPAGIDNNECYSPWWGRFGGINDRMAILGPSAAPIYFTLYNSINALLQDGCPFHPESLLLAHLEKNGVKVNHTLNAIFSTLRMPRPHPQNPLQMIQQMRPPEIQSHEIAEYARS